jgi:hypothetical protein
MTGGEHMWISGDKVLADLHNAKRDKSLGCLNFVDVYFTDANIKRMELALKGRQFEKIGIMSCRGKVDEALLVIFESVQVECLRLDCLHIKPSTARVIGEGVATCRSLKCLVLQALCMTETLAQSLEHGLSRTSSLESLYLSAISARNSDRLWTEIILEAFRKNRSLKHLGIARVRGMDPAKVFQSIQSHESLESISFACLDGVAPSTLTALDDLSRSSKSKLKTVKLSVRGDWTNLWYLPNQFFGGRLIRFELTISTSSQCCDMRQLGEILVRNELIESLSLAHCGLDENSIAQLASFLGKVKGLKYLGLQGNLLNSGRGCDALLAALEHNRSLERIDMPAIVEQKRAIDHLLDWNRAGRRLFQDLDAPMSLWPLVLDRADKIDYTRSYPLFKRPEEVAARRASAIFHLLQRQALC